MNFRTFKLVLEKAELADGLGGRGTKDQIANIPWIIEKESSRKTSTSALLSTPNPLTVWITQTVENSERDENTS